GEVIVAEGYMDVIALAAAGFDHAVAPLGTALTDQQLKLLWRMADEPILCFDGDEAGGRAAYRAAEAALPLLSPGKSLRFAYLPEGLDPDDLIRREGAGAMRAVLEQAKPLIDVIWQRETSAGTWTTPERRAALEARLRALSQTIAEPTVRNYYSRAFKDRLFHMFRAPAHRQTLQGGRRSAHQYGTRRPSRGYAGEAAGASEALANSPLVRRNDSGAPAREAVIVQALLRHPWLLDDFADDLATLQFENAPARQLLNGLTAAHITVNKLDIHSLRHHLHQMGLDGALQETERLAERELGSHFRSDASREVVEAGWRHIMALHRKASALKDELSAAEDAFVQEQSEDNFARLRALSEELANFDQIVGNTGE
ncbi:MAG: toprim domain-containing protein, partial [Dichotomicrobium sp.]